MSLNLSEKAGEKLEEKSISENEISDCVSEKVDEGWEQEQAVAACIAMAEEGSTEPSKEVDTMNPEEKKERVNDINENREELKTTDLKVTGKDVEVVKESQDNNEEIVVNVPIQALSEDRDGDFINEKGQEAIIKQLKSGTVPLMLNHGVGSSAAMYDARDIVGQFVDGNNQNGTTIGTARMRMNKEGEELHSDAREIVDLLEQDMPLGFSVGFIPQEVDEKENGGMEISDLDLMEVSAVGIPSNPDAVPQAMGTAAQMAKNAGLSKNKIMSTIEKAFNDTMTEKQESQDGQEQNNDSKSEEEKQVDSGDVEAMMEVVGSKINEHLAMAMDEAEDEIMDMIGADDEENEEETDEMDDEEETEGDHGDESDEEISQESSDHTEDKDGKSESSESEDDASGEKDSGLDEDEKTVSDNENNHRKLSTDNEEEQEEKSEDEDEVEDPFAVRQLN